MPIEEEVFVEQKIANRKMADNARAHTLAGTSSHKEFVVCHLICALLTHTRPVVRRLPI